MRREQVLSGVFLFLVPGRRNFKRIALAPFNSKTGGSIRGLERPMRPDWMGSGLFKFTSISVTGYTDWMGVARSFLLF